MPSYYYWVSYLKNVATENYKYKVQNAVSAKPGKTVKGTFPEKREGEENEGMTARRGKDP